MSAHSLVVASLVLSAASVGEAVAWCVLAARAVREWRRSTFVRDALGGPDVPLPPVSVVIPAHNEERGAAECARSVLASDYPSLELVFVLDRCTDGTRAALAPLAAADPRLVLLENGECPPDWAGKCNAARAGAARARGELLLFADADTRFDPLLVRAAVRLLRGRRLDMLSLWSSPTQDLWFERIVQPVAAIMMLKLFPIRRIDGELRRRAFANGQFMLFERGSYDRFGGHAAVKDDLLEDLAFARGMRRSGFSQDAAVADGMLEVSMYDSWRSFRDGWKRIFIESCVRNPDRLRSQAVQLGGFAILLPLARVLSGALALWALARPDGTLDDGARALAAAAVAASAAAWTLRTSVLAGVYRAGGFPAWSALLFGVGAAAIVRVLLAGARDLVRRVPVRWGGREYLLEPSKA